MNFALFLKGIFMGLALAAPVGPIGLLCIQRTLNEGRVAGFCSGLGATAADMIYGGLAGFGVTLVSNFLVRHQQGLHLIGSAVICYLGLKIFLSKPPTKPPPARGTDFSRCFFLRSSSCFPTLLRLQCS